MYAAWLHHCWSLSRTYRHLLFILPEVLRLFLNSSPVFVFICSTSSCQWFGFLRVTSFAGLRWAFVLHLRQASGLDYGCWKIFSYQFKTRNLCVVVAKMFVAVSVDFVHAASLPLSFFFGRLLGSLSTANSNDCYLKVLWCAGGMKYSMIS